MSKIDLIDNGWVDLVFDGRNQSYGAYKLRKDTGKRNLLSLLVMAIVAIVIGISVSVKNAIEACQ